MSYNYKTERPKLFTEDGLQMLLKIKDTARLLIKNAGACNMTEACRAVRGDSWTQLACLDYLVEIGELREVTAGMNVNGQDRIYVRGSNA
jgi:hypothetical protein